MNQDFHGALIPEETVAKGLVAFHRKEMVHQDLRPEDIMVDAAGMARIIDFGSTKVGVW